MITKAIIPVAGWGTRRLPITKVIEKCMLPIGNRPIVDYVVEDCLKAGINDIYFVISPSSVQLKAYYSDNKLLDEYLMANNKQQYLADVNPQNHANFHYIIQDNTGKYGTAIPVTLVAPYLDDKESVVVLMGDDFIYNANGDSEVSHLIKSAGNDSAMIGVNIAREDVGRYGVLQLDKNKNFIQIVEKPKPADAPSTLINVSKYVLNHDAIQEIIKYTSGLQSKEYYITDPINNYVMSGSRMRVVETNGQYLDGGSLEGWLTANEVICAYINASTATP
jgi:UTP--glucose-1-phosphate uridylyltransferase